MAGKRKALTVEMPAAIRAPKPRAAPRLDAPASPEEIERRWEQIRVRGEQISADIDALLARVSAHTP